MSKRKILTLALLLCMVAILAVGGSLAYFTAGDSATNVFTMGSVSIDLIESQYHRVNAGRGDVGNVPEPLQGGYLWASNVTLRGNTANTPDAVNASWSGKYFSDDQIKADAASYKSGYFAEKSQNMVPGNNVRKNPYVINTSKTNPAYVRVRVLVPAGLFKILDKGATFWTTAALNSGAVKSNAVAAYNSKGLDGFIASYPTVSRGGESCFEFDFTYQQPLAPEAMTFWNVWGNIAIDPRATAADLAGVEEFDVIIEADAIQAEGFASAEEAFAAFDAA